MSNARCPLQRVEWGWSDDPYAEARQPLPPQACDALLHLVWSFDVLLESTEDIDGETAAADACTDQWEVVCENGHTIARSSGEENAEPFIFSTVFPRAGSVDSERPAPSSTPAKDATK